MLPILSLHEKHRLLRASEDRASTKKATTCVGNFSRREILSNARSTAPWVYRNSAYSESKERRERIFMFGGFFSGKNFSSGHKVISGVDDQVWHEAEKEGLRKTLLYPLSIV